MAEFLLHDRNEYLSFYFPNHQKALVSMWICVGTQYTCIHAKNTESHTGWIGTMENIHWGLQWSGKIGKNAFYLIKEIMPRIQTILILPRFSDKHWPFFAVLSLWSSANPFSWQECDFSVKLISMGKGGRWRRLGSQFKGSQFKSLISVQALPHPEASSLHWASLFIKLLKIMLKQDFYWFGEREGEALYWQVSSPTLSLILRDHQCLSTHRDLPLVYCRKKSPRMGQGSSWQIDNVTMMTSMHHYSYRQFGTALSAAEVISSTLSTLPSPTLLPQIRLVGLADENLFIHASILAW